MSWQNLPVELKALRQWVAVDGEITKRPINPHTGGLADVTDPTSWGSFEEAVSCGHRLIGFVLTKEDPYVFVDLDTKKVPELANLHAEIVKNAASYTETSISGKGTHILVRAKLDGGYRADTHGIEMYGDGRYMLATGWQIGFEDEIREGQEIVDYLKEQIIKQRKFNETDFVSEISSLSDEEVWERAANADNGEKFKALWEGNWRSYPEYQDDHSRADLALATFLDFYTRDIEQAVRLFKMSALYRSNKGRTNGDGTDYILRTLKSARARNDADKPLPVDSSELFKRAQLAQEKELSKAPIEKETALPLPPGLMGEIALYLYHTSLRPVPQISLMGAMALMAGLCGRQFNIPGSGLNLYLLLLAPTGSGKEAVASGISQLMSKVRETVPGVDSYIGPADFASGPALIKALDRQPCFFSILGEFGLRMQVMADSRASGSEKTLQKALLNLYNKSGWHQSEASIAYSDKEKNTSILYAPSLTIFGETTPETFFNKLSEEHIASGLLPRFIFMQYDGLRPARNKVSAFCEPSPQMVQKVVDLVSVVIQHQANQVCQPVTFNAEALEILNGFDEKCDAMMNAGGELYKQLWSRAHLKALRVAALLAVGCNSINPIVDEECAKWAVSFIQQDVQLILDKFTNEEVGEGDAQMEQAVRHAILAYLSMDEATRINSYGIRPEMAKEAALIPYTYLRRRCRQSRHFKKYGAGATKLVQSTLDEMVKAEILTTLDQQVAATKYFTKQKIYALGSDW